MRYRSGKGEILVFDEKFLVHMEKMRKEKGFYPSLRILAETCDLPQMNEVKSRPDVAIWGYAARAVRRLAAAGKLSDEALKVYTIKQHTEKTNEKGNKKGVAFNKDVRFKD